MSTQKALPKIIRATIRYKYVVWGQKKNNFHALFLTNFLAKMHDVDTHKALSKTIRATLVFE